MYVFLDTNIYIGASFSFGNPHLKKLSELVSDGEINLLSCSTCKGEVEKHIKSDLKKAIKDLNKVLKMKEFASLRNEYLYKERLTKMEEDSTIEFVINNFRDFLFKNNATMFSLEGVSIEEIMQDYFEQKAPFEMKKPNEFKDAIMIKALKLYQSKLGEDIVVISADNGFRHAFAGNNNFIAFEKITDFLQYRQRADDVQMAFEKYFYNNSQFEDIQEALADLAKNSNYSFDEREEFEILDIQIDDIKYEFNYAEVKEFGSAKAYLTVYFSVKTWNKYLDLENSYYDKEDNEYIIRSYIKSEEVHQFESEVILDFNYEEEGAGEEKYHLAFGGINADMYNLLIDLSEDTLIDCINEINMMSERDMEWFDANVVKCSECEKVLGFDDTGNCHDYNGDPLCYECAVTNEKGFICPICGFKNTYDRMGNSGDRCIRCDDESDY